MSIQLRDVDISYNPERATHDKALRAILPEGAFSPQWLYKDKGTKGEWRYEEHRRGYDTDTLEDLWGTEGNEVEFRCSWFEYFGDHFFGVPVPEQVWGPPMKVHTGELGHTRPLLMLRAPDWDQKNHGITSRDNYAQLRVVYFAKIRVAEEVKRGHNTKLVSRTHDFDWRMNPHSLQANPEGGPPYDFVTGDYAHVYRGTRPILLDYWRIRDIGNHAVAQHYGPDKKGGFSRNKPGWEFEEHPWVFIDIKYGKDSRWLDARSGWNEAFGCQRISHNHVNPWKVYEIGHDGMLSTRYFKLLEPARIDFT